MPWVEPENEAQLVDLIRWAAAENEPLEVVGRGSLRAIGRPVDAGHVASTKRLSGLQAYEPTELYVTAAAGTPLDEVTAALAERGQRLAFEPRDLSGLFGEPGSNTVGGMVAAALSGPRRPWAGAVRDHVLGFRAVSGRGEVFKSGGTVVKNVTGYDLSKLIAGSFGTLAVMSEVTLRTVPLPHETATVVLRGKALTAFLPQRDVVLRRATLSGSAFLSGPAAASAGLAGDAAALLFRFEGDTANAAAAAAHDALGVSAEAEMLDGETSANTWRAVRDLTAFAEDKRPLWRVSLPRTSLAGFVAALDDVDSYLVDWDGGQVWFISDLDTPAVRSVLHRCAGEDGHATLIRAPEDRRRRDAVFQPQPAALAMLTGRVKAQFDPNGILNPGRLGEDL